jgi:serine protease AprX
LCGNDYRDYIARHRIEIIWRRFMSKARFLIMSSLALLLLSAWLLWPRVQGSVLAQQQAQAKITPWVIQRTAAGQMTEFLVILAEQADLSAAAPLRGKQEKGRSVRTALWQKAQATQKPLLAWLTERGIEHRAYYIVNLIWVRADRQTALALAARPEVARIEGNPRIRNVLPEEQQSLAPESPAAIELGINFVRAPEVWAAGFTGQGIVVGSADTGVEWAHPALKSHYRGWNGTTASHDYNWHDSIHTGGGSCGPNSTQPCDDNNHGTHTTGTAVGDDNASNQIGMAPGAKWIGCRNMDQGNGTPATYIECFEFFLAPYPVGGTPAQGDSSKAPDVTINSWSCPPSEGCAPNTLQAALAAQRAAGIMTVVAAGNEGPACSTASDPPGIYDDSYTVGAFSASTGNIASFSSRGPVTIDGSGRLKPDITAPGVIVRSSIRGGGYSSFNGTSMATPHVAGAVALLWSAHPELRQQLSLTEEILNATAVKVFSAQCGAGHAPNNTYGYGRLDIKAAVDQGLVVVAPTSQSFAANGGAGNINVFTLATANWMAMSNEPWVTITGGSSGMGNGTVSYTVESHNDGTPRSGSITVAGRTFPVVQGAAYNDVSGSHPFYEFIGKLSARGITLGCGSGNYCPDSNVTREQMAIFIERALGVFTPPPGPGMPTFADVPNSGATDYSYEFIEDFATRGIAQGCQAGPPPLYCPTAPVTREQMAIFIERALGVFMPPPGPAIPTFADVLNSGATDFSYEFIEEFYARGMTQGCTAGPPRLYCPTSAVTRGQMAVFLVRAFGL